MFWIWDLGFILSFVIFEFWICLACMLAGAWSLGFSPSLKFV